MIFFKKKKKCYKRIAYFTFINFDSQNECPSMRVKLGQPIEISLAHALKNNNLVVCKCGMPLAIYTSQPSKSKEEVVARIFGENNTSYTKKKKKIK